MFVRPIRPEDEPLIHELLRHVTLQDLRLRFFAPMKHFSHEFIARLTQLDYARAMAFVAFDEATNELVGVVRIHSDSIYETGEYAILLRSDLKGRGLGWALMQMIIEYARSEGLKTISGDVLADNTVMLAMCRSLGLRGQTGSGRARYLRRQADALGVGRRLSSPRRFRTPCEPGRDTADDHQRHSTEADELDRPQYKRELKIPLRLLAVGNGHGVGHKDPARQIRSSSGQREQKKETQIGSHRFSPSKFGSRKSAALLRQIHDTVVTR